ncbi:Sugar O-acyltransferase, sialic acid O-acetyltransferase NeuD family [Candidatus Terasakiella magnetica]|nr:Sugar O-acyltransferase, sialic acid O-acetyltransferase NeuD family [Candidatus Terasakiella magnetica]
MTEVSVIILGAGGHAKVLLAALARMGQNVAGLVDGNPGLPQDGYCMGLPILGDDTWLLSRPVESVRLVNGLGSTGPTAARTGLYQRFKAAGFAFLTVLDPESRVEPDCCLGEGAQVLKGVLIQPGVRIGANTIVNTGAIIDHDCTIGENSHIASGAVLSGGVWVGMGCHVGAGAVVRQGIELGEGAVVGAGGVVVSRVPAGAVVYGNPARVVK